MASWKRQTEPSPRAGPKTCLLVPRDSTKDKIGIAFSVRDDAAASSHDGVGSSVPASFLARCMRRRSSSSTTFYGRGSSRPSYGAARRSASATVFL
eukprot:362259-Chlamydomonas_euryale.AAC.3